MLPAAAQTATHVVVTVMIKNLAQEDVQVDFMPHEVSMTIKLHTGSDYKYVEYVLAHLYMSGADISGYLASS